MGQDDKREGSTLISDFDHGIPLGWTGHPGKRTVEKTRGRWVEQTLGGAVVNSRLRQNESDSFPSSPTPRR